MHSSPDLLLSARLANLAAAMQAVLREAQDDGYDGISVSATLDDGETAIDLQYLIKGAPMGGQSL